MTTQEIARELVALCAKGEFEKAQKELYAADAVSIEPYATDAFPKEVKGLSNLHKKVEAFQAGVEKMYSITASEPLVTSGAIAFTLTMDVDMKGEGRKEMTEICVYEVKEGKIISEQFFF
jgi:hypothetical protein